VSTLVQRLLDLATAIGTDVKSLRSSVAGVPSSVALPRTHTFDKNLTIYNLEAANVRRLNAALGRAYANSGLAQLFFCGDSETDCYDGGPNGGFDQMGAWPIVFRNELGLNNAGDGLIRAASFGNKPDPRWTFVGTWTRYQQNWASSSTTIGDYGICRTTLPCTSIDILYSNASGNFSWQIDSGQGRLSGTVTPPQNFAWGKVTITGLPNTVHSVKIVQTTATSLAIRGINAYSATGLLIHNAAEYGFQAASWNSYNWNDAQTINEAYHPPANMDCVFYANGANDVNAGRTPAQITADITAYRNRYPTSDFFMFLQPYPSGYCTEATWQALQTAMYALADSLNCPLMDMYAYFGNYTTANANGVMTDTVHLNTAGERAWGTVLGQAIGGNMASVPTSTKNYASREIARTIWR
jgi:lysophospholipase L1-like esterase